MAVAKPAAVETPFDIEKMMEIYQQDRAADQEWKQKTESYIRGLHANRDSVARSAALVTVTQKDVMFAGGGAVVGGSVAYIGATQGFWELSPMSVGLGMGGGAVAGVIAGRLFSQD